MTTRAKVLITGGAGFLGVNLLRFLRSRDYALASYDLAPLDAPDLAGEVEAIRGDVRDGERVARALEGVNAVVHAAAALPLYSADDIHTTDVGGTRAVLDAARRRRVSRVIHISSTAVYGILEHAPAREDDPLVGVGPYGKAKVEAESVCREFRDAGMVVMVIRPATFIGPERLGVFDLLFDWALAGRHFPVLGRGDHRHQFLHVEDVCRAVESGLGGSDSAVNDTFNVGAREFGTLRSDFQAVLDEAGFGKKIVSLPVAPAIAALRMLSAVGLSPLYPWVYENLDRDVFVSIDKAEERLGFRPLHSNTDAFLSSFRWYRDHHAEFGAKSGVSHRVPWKQGALRFARLFF